ncbi:MAG: BREX system Lon protease-like protein BrxL, partial [Planctomycetes bacterium]|nr:BREX system Lon protease-like protein BrxL [Planctomycetota bacterium]
QQEVDRILREHYVDSSEKEMIKSRIREQGEYKLLGPVRVRLDERRDRYWAEMPAIDQRFVRIAPRVLEDYGEALLCGGAWGTATVEYDATFEEKGVKYPFNLREFRPLQVTGVTLEDYRRKREQFSDEEWIDLLILTIGFQPEHFTPREKMLFLLRLVPYVEKNYNLLELGPRQTGKTYINQNTSGKAFIISGSTVTPPTLFYNANTRRVGLLGTMDVVFFDEIARTTFSNAEDTLNILKQYMQSGQFTRSGQAFQSQASISLSGNIECDLERKRPLDRYAHLFEALPPEMRDDSAFLDRLHAYLPGWELPKIMPERYAGGYGFLTSYFAEVLSLLRRENYQTHVNRFVDFGKTNDRDQTGVKKTASGLLKLLYPHRTPDTITAAEFKPCLELAVECRQRIIDQLKAIAPSEFGYARLRESIRVLNS